MPNLAWTALKILRGRCALCDKKFGWLQTRIVVDEEEFCESPCAAKYLAPKTRFKLPREAIERFRRMLDELRWGEKEDKWQRREWALLPVEEIVFAQKTHGFSGPICFQQIDCIFKPMADWIIGTDRRLVLPLETPLGGDYRKRKVISIPYPEINGLFLGNDGDLFVSHSSHGVWKVWKFSLGEPDAAERQRVALYNFLKDCLQGVMTNRHSEPPNGSQ